MTGPGIVVVGTSQGGLDALRKVLAGLPGDFPLPVAVVQHRGKEGGEHLSGLLQAYTRLTVEDALDKSELERGHVYIGPADYHILVEGDHLALSTDEPVNFSRPSIDVLFDSASVAFGPATVAVVLTGASQDGVQGAALVKARGGLLVVQDPASAQARTLPSRALQAVVPDRVLDLVAIPLYLLEVAQEWREGVRNGRDGPP